MDRLNPRIGILALAVMALVGGSLAAISDDRMAMNKAIWMHHLQSAMSGDVEAAINDFADNAVLFTKGRSYSGRDEIRGYLAGFIKAMTPEAAKSMKVDYESYSDETIFFNFTVGAWKRSGTNFVVIKDGKFVYVESISYPTE